MLINFCRSQKDNLKYQEQQEEQRMLRNQKDYLDLEVRKFRRRKLIAYHQLEQDLLREVETLTHIITDQLVLLYNGY